MSLAVSVIGTDYAKAPVAVRSRFSFTETQKITFSGILMEHGCREAVILSTCNRSEVYFYGEDSLVETAKELLFSFFGVREPDCLYAYTGKAALEHLLRVASGLESAVIGEDQILGQVRNAHSFAAAAGFSGKILNKIFREAVTAAKAVKTELAISTLPLSVSYIGIKKLSQTLGGLAGKRFLVIGTGEMGRLAVKYLQQEHAGQVFWCSRSCGTGQQEGLPQAAVVPFAARYDYIPEVDGIVTATASPHTVLTREKLQERTKPLCIVDMAVPRDTQPEIGEMRDVTLFDIDALTTVSAENLSSRQALSRQAGEMAAQKAQELETWLFQSRVDTAVSSLNARCEEIARDTEAYLCNKLHLSDREKRLITKMIRSSLRRVVREPVLRLKELDSQGKQEEYLKMIRELFDFEEKD